MKREKERERMNDGDGGQSAFIFHRRGVLVCVEKPGGVPGEGGRGEGWMDGVGETSS